MPRNMSRRQKEYNYWPGFVDVLSTLLIVVLFLLLVFILAHFFLGKNLSHKTSEIHALQTQVYSLGKELSLERREKNETLNLLKSAEQKNEALLKENKLQIERLKNKNEELALSKKQASLLAVQADTMNKELKHLSDLLAQSEEKSKQQNAQIVDLGKQLNRALAQKTSELSYYRSDFFGRLRKILEDNENITIEGDRFVFQSELFFKSGSAELELKGKKQLDALAKILLEISPKIPSNIAWIVRVDGHTDDVPIRNEKYKSNWQLSTDRALSVVYYLKKKGVPEKRLAATGFGEFHPLLKGKTEKARRKNRRIEFKLTEK